MQIPFRGTPNRQLTGRQVGVDPNALGAGTAQALTVLGQNLTQYSGAQEELMRGQALFNAQNEAFEVEKKIQAFEAKTQVDLVNLTNTAPSTPFLDPYMEAVEKEKGEILLGIRSEAVRREAEKQLTNISNTRAIAALTAQNGVLRNSAMLEMEKSLIKETEAVARNAKTVAEATATMERMIAAAPISENERQVLRLQVAQKLGRGDLLGKLETNTLELKSIGLDFNAQDARSLIIAQENPRGIFMTPTMGYDGKTKLIGYSSQTVTLEDGTVLQVAALPDNYTITQADAERDLNRRIVEADAWYAGMLGPVWAATDPRVKTALQSLAYWYGHNEGALRGVINAVRGGNNAEVAEAIQRLTPWGSDDVPREGEKKRLAQLAALVTGAALEGDPAYAYIPLEEKLAIKQDAERRADNRLKDIAVAAKSQMEALLNNQLQRATFDPNYNLSEAAALWRDGQLSPEGYNQVRIAVERAHAAEKDIRDAMARVAMPGQQFIEGNAQDEKDANTLATYAPPGMPSFVQRIQAQDPATLSNLEAFYSQTRLVPQEVARTLSSMVLQGTPDAVSFASRVLVGMEESSVFPRQAFRNLDEARKVATAWDSLRSFYPEDRWPEILAKLRSPDLIQDEVTAKAFTEHLQTKFYADGIFNVNPVLEAIWPSGFLTSTPSLREDARMNGRFEKDFIEAYRLEWYRLSDTAIKTSVREETALKNAALALSRKYGVSEVGSDRVFMEHPPANYLPAIENSHGWLEKAAEEDLGPLLKGQRFLLRTTPTTRRDIERWNSGDQSQPIRWGVSVFGPDNEISVLTRERPFDPEIAQVTGTISPLEEVLLSFDPAPWQAQARDRAMMRDEIDVLERERDNLTQYLSRLPRDGLEIQRKRARYEEISREIGHLEKMLAPNRDAFRVEELYGLINSGQQASGEQRMDASLREGYIPPSSPSLQPTPGMDISMQTLVDDKQPIPSVWLPRQESARQYPELRNLAAATNIPVEILRYNVDAFKKDPYLTKLLSEYIPLSLRSGNNTALKALREQILRRWNELEKGVR